MCLKCHAGLSDETISLQLQEQLDKDIINYTIYNSTSINHIIVAASGHNGLDVRNKAITLLNNYYEWLTSNRQYILDPLLSPERLIVIIEKIKLSHINHNDLESLENYLSTIYE